MFDVTHTHINRHNVCIEIFYDKRSNTFASYYTYERIQFHVLQHRRISFSFNLETIK